ncbi:unnamed protein product [Didymodactylos carnosus]|uniref:Uncharacterized protein n=1 Tax=Didymodactylos carnosus TaxID=1234261 RepID=A0A815DAY1_9BILA|nr:unnamed protein product [Didymodactylos carnosus]CAF4104754.1 unnamed protein product [Didymodactylos carnosus]
MSTRTLGNYDGQRTSYSAETLQNYNITPGSYFIHSGFQFTWPNVPAGQPNNVETMGQSIACNGISASALGIIGSAEQGASFGPLVIQYTDGTNQSNNLSFTDWTNSNPPAGTQDIVSSGVRYECPGGTCTNSTVVVCLFLVTFTLDSSRSLQAITLPNNTHLHIFALGTPCNTLSTTPTPTTTATTTPTCLTMVSYPPPVADAVAAAGTYGTNVVINGDAETGPCASAYGASSTPTSWTPAGTITQAAYTNSTANSDQTFTTPGPSSAIDNNMVTYNLSAWLGGILAQDDSAAVSFTFLDKCYGLLGTSGTIGPVKAVDRSSLTELLYRSTSGSVLPNTRYVNIQVVITRFSGSTSNGDVDDISLVFFS